MLFNSWQFFIFFPVMTALYFALPHKTRWALLLTASCVFYMAFIPEYIFILLFTIVIDYAAGLMIADAQGTRRRVLLLVSIVANVGVLAFFKYFNFFSGNLEGLAQFLHWNYSAQLLELVLPIGLSFHIFQSLSYTIEVYRGHQAPERHLGIYALYVMFYPQLVAGPIERPQNLLQQFRTPHTFDAARVSDGLRRMLWGLFKKVVVADRLALIVGPVFAAPTQYTGVTLLMAVAFFAIQIYCDFSGYSDIAIGAAKVMGFNLMENFRLPYYARSIAEFWSRWHISLSTWFRDYIYIPLGGNRVGELRWAFNTMVVFLVSGLWHGANWTFIVWGAIHGLLMVAVRWSAGGRMRLGAALRFDKLPTWLRHGLSVLTTTTVVALAWIFFRAETLPHAWYIVTHLLSGLETQTRDLQSFWTALRGPASRTEFTLAVAAILTMEAIHLAQLRGWTTPFWQNSRPIQRWAVYYAAVMSLICFGVFNSHAFIYFQF